MAITATLKSTEYGLNDDGYYDATLVYLCETDSPSSTTVSDVEAALPIALYDPLSFNTRCRARSFRIVRVDESDTLYRASIKFSSKPLDGHSGNFPTDLSSTTTAPSSATDGQQQADLRLPIVTCDDEEVMVPKPIDIHGNPAQNTAGDPLEGIEIPEMRTVINIEYYSKKITMAHVKAVKNKVNDSTWNGFPAYTLRVKKFKVDEVYENYNGSMYLMYKVNIQLLEKPDGWNPLKVLNAGKRQRVGGAIVSGVPTGGRIDNCLDVMGNPVSDSVPLDLDGSQLAAGGTVNYIDLDFYETMDFTTLMP